MQHFKLLFFLPVALAGFHPVIFFVVHQVGVLFQFWQHTEHIKRLHPAIDRSVSQGGIESWGEVQVLAFGEEQTGVYLRGIYGRFTVAGKPKGVFLSVSAK